MGRRPLRERTLSRMGYLTASGASVGLTLHMIEMVMQKQIAKMMPGMMPAANSFPTDSPVIMPYRMKDVEGGIRMPRVPPAAMEPQDRLSS